MPELINIGPHRVSRGCISNPDLAADLLNGEVADVFYSDPPWGAGNVKYWHTMRRKMTGNEDTDILTYESLNKQLQNLISKHVKGPVYIETGLKWAEPTRQLMLAAGCPEVLTHSIQYSGGLPNVLLTGRNDGGDLGKLYVPENRNWNSDLSRYCVEAVAVKGGILLDPCCGMGWSSRAAVHAGMRFRGNELNEARLQKTVDWLQKRV